MCIRDRIASVGYTEKAAKEAGYEIKVGKFPFSASGKASAACLLYTSDAADERSSVDLGGRRIIKKKQKTNSGWSHTSKKNYKNHEQDETMIK